MKELIFLALGAFLFSFPAHPQHGRIRKPVDPIGFATEAWQMDSVMARIDREFGSQINSALAWNKIKKYSLWKMAICPHDDYAYAGWMYPLVLQNIKAPTVLLIGVAHKAKKYKLEDKMVFDSFTAWSGPYGPVKVSWLREKIMNQLPMGEFVVHDSLQMEEHSLEALIPFLQYYNKEVEIIPILVPYMSFERLEGLAGSLSWGLSKVLEENSMQWMKDIAIVISTDAVHYGCEEWGGQDYAPYGCNDSGYMKAIAHESEIIGNCLDGGIAKLKIRRFSEYTIQDTNFRSYKWTWCGRYSVPFGLLTAFYLQQHLQTLPAYGVELGYSTSIDHPVIPVTDLKMGVTAPATIRHWVGYVAIGFK
ncbi:MAG: AmmeMemoRadiSam system protein B [bacterium]